jgi:diguanylate cyclase (GGDEF)-like protein
MSDHAGRARDEHQTLADRDQTTADADQSNADFDQTSADADQSASERDQVASDRDQEAADRDQATSELSSFEVDGLEDYALSRRARSQSTLERDQTTHARTESSRIRDDAAARRDRLADDRDEAARTRDGLATELDTEIEQLERALAGDGRAADVRERAAAIRARAALQREAAARDRERAAHDRRQAAIDREAASEELALEGIDHLTGALRRRIGLAAIQREMDRSRRTGERLVVAFVDVDGLKAVNDADGHGAGDDLLREVARAIHAHVRSYDVVTRVGGDEFVCSLAGQDMVKARARFGEVARQLTAAIDDATFTVGLAEYGPDDTLDALVRRADAAMMDRRR